MHQFHVTKMDKYFWIMFTLITWFRQQSEEVRKNPRKKEKERNKSNNKNTIDFSTVQYFLTAAVTWTEQTEKKRWTNIVPHANNECVQGALRFMALHLIDFSIEWQEKEGFETHEIIRIHDFIFDQNCIVFVMKLKLNWKCNV